MIKMTTDTFPEFETDFTRLRIDQIPAHRVNAYIDHCLKDKEFRDLTMNNYGSYVLGASKNLLSRSGELLFDLGALQDFIDPPTTLSIDWAELKRQERANNLKLWWEKKKKRSELMRSLAKLYPKGKGTNIPIHDTAAITELASVFSPVGNTRRDFHKQLQDSTPTAKIPWRHIIIKQVKDGTQKFTDLKPVIQDKKKDAALQFQYLNELRHHQHIDIHQDTAFGEIQITPKGDFNPNIQLKDETGNRTTIDWISASKQKRNLTLKYLKESKVILADDG